MPRRRSLLRRYLEVRGAIGGFGHPELIARLRTADGVTLRGSYLARAGDTSVLLAHGFAANRRKPSYARLAQGIARELPVLALDLRGHGASRGRSTLGDREAMDVEAGVEWLRRLGFSRVVLVGASMGGTAVLHAAARGVEVLGVAVVSAPAVFRAEPPSRALAQLDSVWRSAVRRRALRLGFGVALAGPEQWRDPPHPVQMVAEVQAPLLVVHGDDDGYFPLDDAQQLARASAGPATVWHEPVGFGHAEDGFSPLFVDRVTAALAELVATGSFPDRAASLRAASTSR